MMWINWRIVFTGLFLILFTFTLAFAWDGNIQGSPSLPPSGQRYGYDIWKDETGIHILSSTPGIPRNFTGTITTDGKIHSIKYSSAPNDTFYRINKNSHHLYFDFYAAHSPEGFSFTITQGDWVDFDLYLDGKRIEVAQIHLGRHYRHPGSNSFRVSLK